MIKTLKRIIKQDKERFAIPKGVQQVIPIRAIWPDGIFFVGNKFSKSYRFEDMNYAVASREDKEAMFLAYCELLNSLDSGATTKITIHNRRLNRLDVEDTLLIPHRQDGLDGYREEYNQMLLDKAMGANGTFQEKIYYGICGQKKCGGCPSVFRQNRFGTDGAFLASWFRMRGTGCDRSPAHAP